MFAELGKQESENWSVSGGFAQLNKCISPKFFIKGKTYNDLVVVEAAMMANLRRALSEVRSMNNSPNQSVGNAAGDSRAVLMTSNTKYAPLRTVNGI